MKTETMPIANVQCSPFVRSLLLLLLVLVPAVQLSARTWTRKEDGRTFEGDFIKRDGDVVYLRATKGKSLGKTFSVRIDILSSADVAFVESAAEGGGRRKPVIKISEVDLIGLIEKHGQRNRHWITYNRNPGNTLIQWLFRRLWKQ